MRNLGKEGDKAREIERVRKKRRICKGGICVCVGGGGEGRESPFIAHYSLLIVRAGSGAIAGAAVGGAFGASILAVVVMSFIFSCWYKSKTKNLLFSKYYTS